MPKRFNKRKINDNNNNEKKRKELKHLKEFGEKHPINDEKLCLEDLCAKRVFDNNNNKDKDQDQDNDKKIDKKKLIENELKTIQTDYYEKLLNVFGRNSKNNDNPETSDDDDDDELENENEDENKEEVDDDINDDNDNDNEDEDNDEENDEDEDLNDNLDEDNDDKNQKQQHQQQIDYFHKHFFTNFESNEIDLLKQQQPQQSTISTPSSRLKQKKHYLENIGTVIESFYDIDCFNFIHYNSNNENLNLKLLKNSDKELTKFQLELLSLIMTYKNLYYTNRTEENAEQIRLIYVIHLLNHVLRTRQRIITNNNKIRNLNQNPNDFIDDKYRDQGFTRPKVLILLPFKHSAYLTINSMIKLLKSTNNELQLMNYKKFRQEYSDNENETLKINKRKKPQDYQKIFKGNINDSFRLGLSLTKKSLKLYTNFIKSDIIIASPLGLRLVIEEKDGGKKDYNFLSSIDIVIMDQMDIFLMQNWEHILFIFKYLHLKPTSNLNIDFQRIKLSTLELWQKYYCQLILIESKYSQSKLIKGFFNNFCNNNFSGKFYCLKNFENFELMNIIDINCKHLYYRFKCQNILNISNDRFNYFIEKILPKFKSNKDHMIRTMIFISSYFDYVRLRNYFRHEDNLSFTQICEYSKPGNVAKARHIFYYGGRQFLLYTERYHFYNRSLIKGIRHLIFYEPPTNYNFYSELINLMNQRNQGSRIKTDYKQMTITMLYCDYDLELLLPLIGKENLAKLISNKNDQDDTVHMFVAE